MSPVYAVVGCAVMLAALGLAACAGSPSAVPPPGEPVATASAGGAGGDDRGGVPADPSYDWHILLGVPFGTSLQSMPLALHEVLLFHDTGRGAGDVGDCYGMDGAGPRFLDGVVDQYVLCFEHDRLTRIEASVMLPSAGAAAVFARACALWREQASPAVPPAPAGRCEGRDHGVVFGARLAGGADDPGSADDPGGADEPAGRVSVTLTYDP